MPKPTTKQDATPAQEPKRMRVKSIPHGRKTLFWPHALVGKSDTDIRGSAGYVVDWTLPWERAWCAGQEYKLEPAPDDAIPDRIELKQALREIARIKGETPGPPKTVAAQKTENQAAAPEPAKSSVPPVAPPPRKESK